MPEFNYYDRQILDVKTNLDKVNMDDNNQNTLTQNQIQILKSAFLDLFHESANEIFVQHLESAKASPDSLLFKMTLTRRKVHLNLNPNSNQAIDFYYDLNLGDLMVNELLADVTIINEFVAIVGEIMALIAAKKTIYKIK